MWYILVRNLVATCHILNMQYACQETWPVYSKEPKLNVALEKCFPIMQLPIPFKFKSPW